MLVGDSLQAGFHETLALSSGVCYKVGPQPPCAGRGCQSAFTLLQCGGNRPTLKLRIVRNDHLDMSERVFQSDVLNVFGTPWYTNFVADNSTKTLILNRGAHWAPTPTVVAEMGALLDAVAKDRPDVLVLVRDTPPGHPGCLKDPHPPLASPPFNSLSWQDHWGEFASQNEAVAEVVRARPNVLLLAVASMTAFRSDSHHGGRDCLHYCMPGPLDAWVEALHRALWGVANLEALREWANAS